MPSAMPTNSLRKQLSNEAIVKKEKVAERRKASIQAREHARAAAIEEAEKRSLTVEHQTSSKYPKSEVMMLKEIFDTYDADGSGSIELSELKKVLKKQKSDASHFDGRKMTLAERQAANGRFNGQAADSKGVFLLQFADSLFNVLDANGDGQVVFRELLRLMYPLASEAEFETMLRWTQPEATVVPLEEFELDVEQEREIHTMFALYDKDRSGAISHAEFRQAMRRCGLDKAETERFFAEADADESGEIDYDEFREFMRRTLYEGEGFTRSMLYDPAA